MVLLYTVALGVETAIRLAVVELEGGTSIQLIIMRLVLRSALRLVTVALGTETAVRLFTVYTDYLDDGLLLSTACLSYSNPFLQFIAMQPHATLQE